MKLQAAKLAILATSLAASAWAVDPGLLEMADPEINLLVGIRTGELASSPLMLKVLAESKKGGQDWSGLIDKMGPNPFASIDEILIMGRMEAGEQPDASQDAVILAHGDFSSPALQDALCSKGCEASSHAGVALLLLEHEGKPAAFAKLSESYAALGAVSKVRDLIDRRKSGGNPQFATRAQEWARGLSRHHIWIAAQGPFEAPKSDGGPPFAQEMLNGLEGVGLGLTMGEELLMTIDLHSKTEDDSKRLYATLQGLLAMAAAAQAGQQGGAGGPADLLQQLQMTQASKRISATLRAPMDEIQKTFAESVSMGSAEPEEEAAFHSEPPRERSGKIRIYGLEAEPVEVEAGQP